MQVICKEQSVLEQEDEFISVARLFTKNGNINEHTLRCENAGIDIADSKKSIANIGCLTKKKKFYV